jgi:hypothetical protein
MPKEIYPSSYLCDCGHQSDFFENTIREIKKTSFKKKIYLSDSEPDEHTIVFYSGDLRSTNIAMSDTIRMNGSSPERNM